jgi:hypothetical protein
VTWKLSLSRGSLSLRTFTLDAEVSRRWSRSPEGTERQADFLATASLQSVFASNPSPSTLEAGSASTSLTRRSPSRSSARAPSRSRLGSRMSVERTSSLSFTLFTMSCLPTDALPLPHSPLAALAPHPPVLAPHAQPPSPSRVLPAPNQPSWRAQVTVDAV